MGRSKQNVPKRRRIDKSITNATLANPTSKYVPMIPNNNPMGSQEYENEKQQMQIQQTAIEILQTAPQDLVEKAAADALRNTLPYWESLFDQPNSNVSTQTRNNNEQKHFSDQNDGSKTKESSRPKRHLTNKFQINPKFPGLALHSEIPPCDMKIFEALHDIIQQKIYSSKNASMASWSGSISDPRRRAFGFLPNTLGYEESVRNEYLDISTPGKTSIYVGSNIRDKKQEDNNEEDFKENEQERNKLASVVLTEEDLPDGLDDALERLLQYFRACIKAQIQNAKNENNELEANENRNNNTETIINGSELNLNKGSIVTLNQTPAPATDSNNKSGIPQTKSADLPNQIDPSRYLTRSNLIAVQPNLHCGRDLLPSHVDHPTKDGFGIVIITIAIRGGGAYVLLETWDQLQKGKFRLMDGQGYMLSGFVRDGCTHGVLADSNCNSSSRYCSKKRDLSDGGNGGESRSFEGESLKVEKDGSFRESLNFRFGLHGWSQDDPLPSQVLKYWGKSF